jgi:hypothetical protein
MRNDFAEIQIVWAKKRDKSATGVIPCQERPQERNQPAWIIRLRAKLGFLGAWSSLWAASFPMGVPIWRRARSVNHQTRSKVCDSLSAILTAEPETKCLCERAALRRVPLKPSEASEDTG